MQRYSLLEQVIECFFLPIVVPAWIIPQDMGFKEGDVDKR